MKTACIGFLVTALTSSLFGAEVIGDLKRPIDPAHFNNKEYEIRQAWFSCFQLLRETEKSQGLVQRAKSALSKKKMPPIFKAALNNRPPEEASLLRDSIIRAYEKGLVCRDRNWITPSSFLRAFNAAIRLKDISDDSLEKMVTHFETQYEHFDTGDVDLNINNLLETIAVDRQEFLLAQEQASKDIIEFIVFSIKNFDLQIEHIHEHFRLKREAVREEIVLNKQEEEQARILIEGSKSLVHALEEYLRNNSLFMTQQGVTDFIELSENLFFDSDMINGNLGHARRFFDLHEKISRQRENHIESLKARNEALDQAFWRFSDGRAEDFCREIRQDYTDMIDVVFSTVRKYWRDRIKVGYPSNMDSMLNNDDTSAIFDQIKQMLEEKNINDEDFAECPFCYEERELKPICSSSEHLACASCIRNCAAGNTMSCPYKDCDQSLKLNYDWLLKEGVSFYDIFEVYKNRWLQEEYAQGIRCHNNCLYFHTLPKDIVPAQSSMPCPDCQTTTCLSCKGKGHKVDIECLSPDVESIRAAEEAIAKLGAYKRCPHCNSLTIRISGCNHMKCESCSKPYNWSEAPKFAVKPLP